MVSPRLRWPRFDHFALGTVPVMVSLLLPPAAAVLWVARAAGDSWPSALGWVSVQVLGLLAGVSAALGVMGGLWRLRWGRVTFASASLVLLVWASQVHRGRFEGTMGLGVGEPSAQYHDVVAGPWADAPVLCFEVTEVRGAPSPECTVLVDGKPRILPVGGTLRSGRAEVRVLEVHPAPLFFLEDKDGKRTVDGYLKIGERGGGPSGFQFELLPHRFFLSPATDAGAGNAADAAIPIQRLRLLVTRGKLTLVNRDVQAGEKVPVDGFTAGFDPGSGWVVLRVVSLPSLWPLALAAALFAGSALLGWLRKGRT